MANILTEALLVGAVGGGLNLDTTFVGQTMVSRPLVSASLIGMLLGFMLGSPSQGFLVGLGIGALLELIWIGNLPVGGSIPPNATLAGVTGASFALLAKGDPGVVFALSVIFAVGVGIITGRIDILERKFNQRLLHQSIRFAEKGSSGGIELMVIGSLAFSFLLTFFICVIIVVLGVNAINFMAEDLPIEIKNGLVSLKYLLPLLGLGVITENFLNSTNWIYLVISFLATILVFSLSNITPLWWLVLFTPTVLIYLMVRKTAYRKSPGG